MKSAATRTLLAVLVFAAPGLLAAQEGDAAPDSAELVEELREAQAEFEMFRRSRIPPRTRTGPIPCDQRIGRICHWYGGAEEADFPPEPPETGAARAELLQDLASAWSRVKDPWVLGQLVYYMVEAGRDAQAESVARSCGLEEGWWCDALQGYVLHVRGDVLGAEAVFRSALETLPEEEDARWRTPRFILHGDGEEAFESADPDQRAVLQERLWRFSDPLFLVDGNDRLTDHYARLVVARIREDAAHPYELEWEEDLEESLIRYGRTVGWSRSRARPQMSLSGEDTRSTVGHHHPASRGYLFPGEFLEAPADIPPESWITAPREAHTWYAAPYAPDFRGLETQVARFRRGDSLLVVGAFRPDPAAEGMEVAAEPDDPFGDPFARGGGAEAPVESALFLVPEDGGESFVAPSDVREGVLTLRAPAGRYVSSLEVLDRDAGAAWRARQGVTQALVPQGLAALSDLLLLREDSPLPDNLEEAIPMARPGIRIRNDERFAIAWEVYGLGVEDRARVTLGFTQGRPGFLQRVGEFLGIVEPDTPVEISFDEALPGEVQTLFRAIHLELPQLEPGEYTLHLRLELGSREPTVVSRPVIVEPAGT